MKNNEKNNLYFENDLFCERDIDFVDEKMLENRHTLSKNKEYIEIDQKQDNLKMQFFSTLNSEQQEFFNEYLKFSSILSSYDNCLAYYLGMQKGINLAKLK